MTGSAKQSIAPLAEAWIASSLTLLAMTVVEVPKKQPLREDAFRCYAGRIASFHSMEMLTMKSFATTISVLTAMILLPTTLLPTTAFASCKQGICVSGRDQGNVHIITFHTRLVGITHYNFKSFFTGYYLPQFELAGNVTEYRLGNIPSRRPIQVKYSMQACRRGGVFSPSMCAPWADFTHTMRQ